ncbi:hypothetical protein ACHAQH_002681 [Verticillium albo-atrum]
MSWLLRLNAAEPRALMLPVLAFSIVLAALWYLRAGKRPPPSASASANPIQDYKPPTPAPYKDWSIETTKPLPYRAFRHGPTYNVTMGLRTLQFDDWIELDNQFPKFHADKAARLRERQEKCVYTDPDALPAAIELLEELVRYLPFRYPSLFKRTAVGIDNLWSGESFDISERPLREDPMAMAARLMQDDVAIMMERPDGQYHLVAGAILLAGFWRLSDKLGMSLEEIHTSGDVPHYQSRLHRGMAGFFRRLRCDQLYGRNNYFIQVDGCLPWSHSIGSEDGADPSWSTAEKDKAIEHHFFRSERQTLRRLPRTRAVVFTIRTYLHPVMELAREDYVPGRLASAVRSWDDKVAVYKGREKYERVLLEYLDSEHQKQVDRGLDLGREDEVRKYPW